MQVDPKEIAWGLERAKIIQDRKMALGSLKTIERHMTACRVEFVRESGNKLIQAGTQFEALALIVTGELIPTTLPGSILREGFVVGLHEYLHREDSAVWKSTYISLGNLMVLWLPLALFDDLAKLHQEFVPNISSIVLKRLDRFYWTSLSTVGPPTSRVAAALLSRLAVDGSLRPKGRAQAIFSGTAGGFRRDLMRITTLSRTAVWDSLNKLRGDRLIDWTEATSESSERIHLLKIDKLHELVEKQFLVEAAKFAESLDSSDR